MPSVHKDATENPVSAYYSQHIYRSGVHPYWHPVRLATTARLLGSKAANPSTARVMNLGCGTGEQLIALAAAYPEASFVGVDVSAAHIDAGNRLIDQLRLTNIELIHSGLEDHASGGDEFDFVVAAGIYSWVPRDVREVLLPLCRKIAARNAVLAVSFNVNPGWGARSVIRELVQDALRRNDAADPFDVALGVLDEIAHTADGQGHYGAQLIENAQKILEDPQSLFFEYMSPACEPFELTEFVADAERSGLRYIAEGVATVPPDVNAIGSSSAFDVVHQQAMDRLHGTHYRAAILQPDEADRTDTEHPDLHFSGQANEVDQHETADSVDGGLFATGQATVRIESPLVAQTLRYLISQHPRSISQTELLRAVGVDDDEKGQLLVDDLVHLHHLFPPGGRPVEVTTSPLGATNEIAERPIVPQCLRVLLSVTSTVPDLQHFSVTLGEVLARIARLLDGSRTAQDVASELLDEAHAGGITLSDHPGDPIPDIADIEQMVVTGFEVLCAQGLLVDSETAAPGS